MSGECMMNDHQACDGTTPAFPCECECHAEVSTDEVRLAWREYAFKDDGSHQGEFDQWLESVKAEAWDEGYLKGVDEANDLTYYQENPYRKEGDE